MIKLKDFWEKESKAPLLQRNAGYFSCDSDITEKQLLNAEGWLDLALKPENISNKILQSSNNIELRNYVEFEIPLDRECEIILKEQTDDPAINRIFKLDAERTFSDDKNRQKMIQVLSTIYTEIQDYHQGLGFVVAFLMLQLSPQDTVKLALALHRYYLPGYFKTAPFNYVRDAKVFQKLLEEKYPELAAKISNAACTEAFCSKWFVGLNVHVLPFPALCKFFELLLIEGNIFLFKFALSIVKNCSQDIFEAKDASKILAILRLDNKLYDDKKGKIKQDNSVIKSSEYDGNFFIHLVEDAMDISVSEDDIEKFRKVVIEEMRIQEEKRKQIEALLDFDNDEIIFSDEE
ncbi:TBC domain-containing protein [Cryptosporidium serpentis]